MPTERAVLGRVCVCNTLVITFLVAAVIETETETETENAAKTRNT